MVIGPGGAAGPFVARMMTVISIFMVPTGGGGAARASKSVMKFPVNLCLRRSWRQEILASVISPW